MSYTAFMPYMDFRLMPLLLFCIMAAILTKAAAKYARNTAKGKKEIAITTYNLELAKFYVKVFPAIPIMIQALTWAIIGK